LHSFAHNAFLFSLEQAQLVYIEIVMLSSSVYNAAFVCGWCHPAEIFWALPYLPIFCLPNMQLFVLFPVTNFICQEFELQDIRRELEEVF
jgi:hypothetical protein